MTLPVMSLNRIFRGATIEFETDFFDTDGLPVQPAGAFVNIVFPVPGGGQSTVDLPMTPPGGGEPLHWTALWDTRGVGPGTVYWSIHSTGPATFAVEDGQFTLVGNAANLVTF